MSRPTPDSHPPKAKGATDQPAADIPQYSRVVGIAYLGTQPEWEWGGKKNDAEECFEFVYEMPNSKMEDGRPHWVSEKVPVNFNDGDGNPQYRSRLMKRVSAICPDGSADRGYNLPAMINRCCMVTPHHNKKGYANVAANAVVGIPAGTVVPELANPSFDWTDWDAITKDMWEKTNVPLIKKRIQESHEYPGSRLKMVVEGTAAPAASVDFDDDIPF